MQEGFNPQLIKKLDNTQDKLQNMEKERFRSLGFFIEGNDNSYTKTKFQ